MKTMTCKQLGGPCDHQLQGDNADAVIAARRQPISARADGERLHHRGVVRGAQVDDAHVGTGVLPCPTAGWSDRGSAPALQADIDRALDLGRISSDLGAVTVEHLALAPPLGDVAERRVPMLRVLGDDAQCAPFAVAADGDRWMRALHRLRLAPCLREREVLTLERRPVLRQQLDDDLDALLELVEALLQRRQVDARARRTRPGSSRRRDR